MTTYTFQPFQPTTFIGGGLLFDYPEHPVTPFHPEAFGQMIARFRGSLLTLFGSPPPVTGDVVFEYYLEARDATGSQWILNAYQGPTGPAIGAPTADGATHAAARALLAQIAQTLPADFQASYYAEEYDSTVTYGCRGGQCFYHEVPGEHAEQAYYS